MAAGRLPEARVSAQARSCINQGRRVLKRILDVTTAVAALVILSPVILLTALAVWGTLGRPLLFEQVRPGLNARPFRILKFRTMRDASGPDGEPLPDALRLTAVGSLMRSWSLDELPSLWNVVRGDLSLVGPRPLLMDYVPLYTPEQFRRHEVRPGITGWAQVNGRNALSWEEKFRHDVWYVDNRSLGLDLKILFMTLRTVLSRKDISATDHPTMPPFRGSQ